MTAVELMKDIADDVVKPKCSEDRFLNKLGFASTEQCVFIVNSRTGICMDQIASKWPNKISSEAEVTEIAGDYLSCLFNTP